MKRFWCLHAVWRLLAEPVPPLDYPAHADALLKKLAALQSGGIDTEILVARTKAVRDKAVALSARATTATPTQIASINRALIAVSRALVPVDYTTGDRFRPDPATPQPPWPSLDAMRLLGSLDPVSDTGKVATVSAMRARNRMAHALAQAITALDIGLTA